MGIHRFDPDALGMTMAIACGGLMLCFMGILMRVCFRMPIDEWFGVRLGASFFVGMVLFVAYDMLQSK